MTTPARPAVKARFRLRVYMDDDIAIGPGKVTLLEAIDQAGSISAAARVLGMSYRRAWLLVDTLNRCLKSPAVAASTGGTQGGGARLTDTGRDIVAYYRRIEAAAEAAARDDIHQLGELLRPATDAAQDSTGDRPARPQPRD